MPAYVYLIIEEPYQKEKTGPWTKIGYSKNPPEWRLEANLKRGNPRNLKIADVFEFDSESAAGDAEQNAHKVFQKHMYQKEWFRIHWKQVSDWFLQSGARRRP